MGLLDSLLNILPSKKKAPTGGFTQTPTYNPFSSNLPLPLPNFQDHLNDIFTTRQQSDTRTLLKQLFRTDPDISSAVNGYLALSNTKMIVYAEDIDGNIDPEASQSLSQVIWRITRQVDYTQGFQLKQSVEQINADMRYMLLLRGGLASELVFDKTQAPDSLRNVDFASIRFQETKPGVLIPMQQQTGGGQPVPITSPAFFVSYYRRDPTTLYADSSFVAAINTIAARTQVINDLYRIMKLTGFPRITAKVIEQVVIENAPANVKADADKLKSYVAARMTEIRSNIENLSADQSIVHSDAVEFKILNDKNPSNGIDITSVIETLNAQNQAALKTMATVLGRGQAGVNTGSVEARMAAMYADELNEPIAEMWSKVLSFVLHQNGFQGFAVVKFEKAELRPDTELEPQRQIKANRLRQDLSDGIITDEEYTLAMYGRLPRPGAPPMSGTKFLSIGAADPVGGVGNTPQPGPTPERKGAVARSASPAATKQHRSNPPKPGASA